MSQQSVLTLILVVGMGILLRYHLDLKYRYEALKIECKSASFHKSSNDTMNQKLQKEIESFMMHSSSGGDLNQETQVIAGVDGYNQLEQSTQKNVSENDFNQLPQLTTSVGLDNLHQDQMSPTQNSKLDKSKSSPEVDELGMRSTTETQNTVMSSQSFTTQASNKKFSSLESKLSHDEERNTNKVHEIKSSMIKNRPQIPPNTNVARGNVDINHFETFRDVSSLDKLTNDLNDATVSRMPEYNQLGPDSAIHSTREESIHVLKTSLQDVDLVKNEGVYGYHDTQDATAVIETENYFDQLDLMTVETGYPNEDVECDDEFCYEFEDDNSAHSNVDDIDDVVESIPHFLLQLDEKEKHQFSLLGTSINCEDISVGPCQFRNLCYNTKERDFVVFKSNNSEFESSNTQSGRPIDLQDININLSTVEGHNIATLSIVTLPASFMSKFSVGLISKPSVALYRFKPDNIMHVLHDDILPLYTSLNYFKFMQHLGVFDAAIAFLDTHKRGSYFDLYSSLSLHTPISPWRLNQTFDLVCFDDLRLGLQTTTLWYQYGFFNPQGPIHNQPSYMLRRNIDVAVKYLSNQFEFSCLFCNKGGYLVFLSRKDNRLILNESEMIMSIVKTLKMKVIVVSLETHSLSEIISTIRHSTGAFGMHGSLLSLSIFLPAGSILIELFPFAVNPSHYTPFKTLCDLPGSGIVYKAWVNLDLSKSVSHPNRPPKEGGISHLPDHKQNEILTQTEVPNHLCCEDPSWLFHIFQDTYVDVDAVVNLIHEALANASENSIFVSNKQSLAYQSSKHNFGSVRNLKCERRLSSYFIDWDMPWVFRYFDESLLSNELKFEIVIRETESQVDGNTKRQFLNYDVDSYEFSIGGDDVADYDVWIQVVSNQKDTGHPKYVKCHFHMDGSR